MGDDQRRRPAGSGPAGGGGASPLRDELLRLRGEQLDTRPIAEIAAYDAAAAAAAEARVVEAALHAEQYLPAVFESLEGHGPAEAVEPSEEGGAPLVIMWYLSGQSPFCRQTLTAWDRALLQGGGPAPLPSLIALTPEAPEAAERTATALGVHYPLLHDEGTLADALGIRFRAPAEFAELLALELDPETPLLPLPACYVAGKNGRICYSFLHPDPRYRAEPHEAIEAAQAGEAGGRRPAQ